MLSPLWSLMGLAQQGRVCDLDELPRMSWLTSLTLPGFQLTTTRCIFRYAG
jgi:hypothetical protein